MNIIHGDFFDESNWKPATAFPSTMPFEKKVHEYLKKHDGKGKTVEDAAKEIGISEAAVYAALASLEAKGIVKWPEDDAPGVAP